MKPAAARERVRCRLINETDLEAVADLLCEGFKGRARQGWLDGLSKMKHREVPEGAPRFGHCLDAGGRLVGVILLIASSRQVDGTQATFTNVASWYVNPDYRAYAQLLVSIALRNKETTFTNVTPAPHTWPIVENQGYTRYCNGLFFAAAALKAPAPGVTLEELTDAHQSIPEFEMLRRHRDLGCNVIVARDGARPSGLVFRPYRIRSGTITLPAMFVIHAPDRPQLVRLAGNLGRHFMWKGAPFLAMDADGTVEGLRGIYTEKRGRKYFKGPHRPALCDLSDTEYAIFGV
jgi:hypothetical protein